jgi:hypothetical protein
LYANCIAITLALYPNCPSLPDTLDLLTWENVIKVGTNYQKLVHGELDKEASDNEVERINNLSDDEFYNEFPSMKPEQLQKMQEQMMQHMKINNQRK